MKVPAKWITPIRIFYTYAFNLYAWYWLYKLIFVLPFNWEDWANWVFACFGMWFFVLDTDDLHFRRTLNKTAGYPELLKKDEL